MELMSELFDEEVIDYLEKKGFRVNSNVFEKSIELSTEVNRLLAIAIAVVERVEMLRDVEYVKKEVEGMFSKIDNALTTKLEIVTDSLEVMMKNNFSPDIDSSYLAKLVQHFRTEIANYQVVVKLLLDNAKSISTDKLVAIEAGIKNAEEKFNPDLETSYIGKLKQSVKDAQEKIAKDLDFTNTNSFAYKLSKDTEKYFGKDSILLTNINDILIGYTTAINNEFVKLREEIAKKEGSDEMLENTAIKGVVFEEELFETLQSIASKYGDKVVMVGTEKETTMSKKGDFVYEFSEGYRLVIEAKDTNVGLKPMLEYMKEALDNRDCEMGLLVTKKYEQLQKQIGLFNFYDGNKLFACADYIEYSIRWIRLYMKAIKVEAVEGVDKNKLISAVESIRSSFKAIKSIKQKMSSLYNSVEDTQASIEGSLDIMKKTIEDKLLEIEGELG